MPSFQHEGLIELFRARPSLAAELVSRVLAVEMPVFVRAARSDSTLGQPVAVERRADLVIAHERAGIVVFSTVVEVQLARDADKQYAWPLYAIVERARHRCPVVVLVVAPDPEVARWASQPIDLGGGRLWRPVVLGPDAIPRVSDPAEARSAPELGVLSAIAHANEAGGAEIALAAIQGLADLDDEHRRMYYDLVAASLGEAVRKELEAMAVSGKYEYQSDFARTYVAKGREEGREEGREAGQREMLLALLRHRGLSNEAVEQRIANAPSAELERWAIRAIDAASVDQIFGDG